MGENRFENYLRDLGTLVREKAMNAQCVKSQKNDPYDIGYLMAWHEVVSLMQSQANQFDITLSQIGLDEIDPQKDLL